MDTILNLGDQIMNRTTFHFSMPESMRVYVEDRLETGGYRTVSEYIRDLVRIDQRAELARLDAAIEQQQRRQESWRHGYRDT